MQDRKEVERLLSSAAATRFEAAGRKAWEYGWCVPEYRRSNRAAIDTDVSPVALNAQGIESYERAVELLLNDPDVRQRYDTDELWGIVASMIATLPNEVEGELAGRLDQLLSPGYSLVVQLIANVTWDSDPVTISNLVVGKLTPEWIELVNASAGERPDLGSPLAGQWLEQQKADTTRMDVRGPRLASLPWPRG
jgi:hypothetical protein